MKIRWKRLKTGAEPEDCGDWSGYFWSVRVQALLLAELLFFDEAIDLTNLPLRSILGAPYGSCFSRKNHEKHVKTCENQGKSPISEPKQV